MITSMIFSYCSVASDVCEYSALLLLLGNNVSLSVTMSACCVGVPRFEVRVAPVAMSGKYPVVVSGATAPNLEVRGAPLEGDSD